MKRISAVLASGTILLAGLAGPAGADEKVDKPKEEKCTVTINPDGSETKTCVKVKVKEGDAA